MKTMFLLPALAVFLLENTALARVCPNNNYKACLGVLEKTYAEKGGDKEFREVYEDICATNSKFRCTKVMVMADPEATLKEMKTEKPKSKLYLVQHDDGKYIYVFEPRGK